LDYLDFLYNDLFGMLFFGTFPWVYLLFFVPIRTGVKLFILVLVSCILILNAWAVDFLSIYLILGWSASIGIRLFCFWISYILLSDSFFWNRDKETSIYADVLFAFFTATFSALSFFILLSWETALTNHALQIHVSLYVISCIFLVFPLVFLKFLSCYFAVLIAAAGLSLAIFTGYSQFYYPSMVLREVKRVVADEKFCIRPRGFRDEIITSEVQLTFLAAPKSTWDAHFKLFTETKTYEWSYHKRQFVEYAGDRSNLDACFSEQHF